DEFLEDLHVIRESLTGHGDKNVADRELKDLIRLVETFGFFLAHLDVRQESSRHTEAVAEILGTHGIQYLEQSEAQRLQTLAELLR
ncbi:MAG: phosphoenolpyruvate carboxylase, partial [Gammaproteobacteria bacterium]|nr:phosphoenolpyruvate carboxylase [Gammaproteobacteria bacterium]NIX87545.1 phosphoenolpyruvate carboxylase [Gammaproteobacteria bacterium]